MGEIIHCRCGRVMECGRTDVLESVKCPACSAELGLDLELGGERRRGYLTVVVGPERRGEQLLIPVGESLRVGSAADNWLCLPAGGVADYHCILELNSSGTLLVRKAGESQVGATRGLAELQAEQMMRVGEYVLRFTVGEVFVPGAAGPAAGGAASSAVRVPMMKSVTGQSGVLWQLTRSRFRVARWFMLGAAVVYGISHLIPVLRESRPNYGLLAMAAALVWAMVTMARRMSMGDRVWNMAALGTLVIAAIVEGILHEWPLMIGLLVLPAGLLLTTERPPGKATSLISVALMTVGLAFVAVGASGLHASAGAR